MNSRSQSDSCNINYNIHISARCPWRAAAESSRIFERCVRVLSCASVHLYVVCLSSHLVALKATLDATVTLVRAQHCHEHANRMEAMVRATHMLSSCVRGAQKIHVTEAACTGVTPHTYLRGPPRPPAPARPGSRSPPPQHTCEPSPQHHSLGASIVDERRV